MTRSRGPSKHQVVRLNATLFPVDEYEASLYSHFNLHPNEVELHTPEEIIPFVSECDGILVVSASLPKAVIKSMNRCRIISRIGHGTDNIDVASATRRGIVVSNAPSFCYQEMADHAMAFLLSLARKLPAMSNYLHIGQYGRAREVAIQLRRLSHSVLGIVGFGASGHALAKRAKSFGLRVLATTRNLDAYRSQADELGVELVDLNTLLNQSDFVSLNLPLTPKTYHMFDDVMIRKMKPGACLINTSRGALIDEDALVCALREGRLAGAGIDTFEAIGIFVENPEPPNHPLLELDNVILTPHVSGQSIQAMEDVHRESVKNLAAVLFGYWPPHENIVNNKVEPRWPLKDFDPAVFNTPNP
jgi:D-3-phosphoglycerate dehydrogenase